MQKKHAKTVSLMVIIVFQTTTSKFLIPCNPGTKRHIMKTTKTYVVSKKYCI